MTNFKIKKENDFIIYNNEKIEYIIEYKKVKNLNVKIREILYITSPISLDKTMILSFLYDNIQKIYKTIKKNNNNIYYNIKKNTLRIIGENFKIIIQQSITRNTWKIIDNLIYIKLKDINDKEKIIKRILKKYAEYYLPKRLNHVSKITNIKYKMLNIKWMTKKWGYCDKKNNIVLSYKIIILDKEMIDYILIHELCHTIEHNHSNNFWKWVEYYEPNYKKIIKDIKSINLI